MRLLIVSYYLPPLISPQSFQVGRLLYHLPVNYKAYVVTADDTMFQRDNNFYGDIAGKFADEITISNSFFLAALGGMFRKTPDIFLLWHMRAYMQILKRWGKERFDAIVTFACPMSSHLLGMWLKKYFNIRWIAFFSDPWAGNPHFNYKGIIKKINSYLERKVFESADMFVFASPEMHSAYMVKYPSIADNSSFIEHSYDPNLYRDIKKEKENKLILRYIGTFYGKRTAAPMLSAIRNLLDRKLLNEGELLFEIIGGVSKGYRRQYFDLLEKYNLNSVVRLREPVPYLESLSLMQGSDVLVLIDAQIDNSVFLPSKLIDYIGSGRPIISITPKNSASARVTNKVGGWVAEPDNIPAIEKALYEIVLHYKDGTLKNFNPLEKAGKEFLIRNNINKFVSILKERQQ